ncbi:MAG: Rpn family recombination-promoting nuclease/putative transposase [Lachnospiraceae bacterium]|nr:Rpn family recombination-promoting nuclease/putative transposase [Lachnospiraceae bacterium]
MAKKKKEVIRLNDQIAKELDKAIDDLNLFDDDLMSKVFDRNIEATELLLRIILERDDIKVLRVKGQVDMKSPYPGGRNIRIDIHAIDNKGVEFDVEVQRNEEGSHIRRARFNGSMMDSRMLKKKQEFKELKDAYVIFICQHDKFGENNPIYHVDKVVRETGKPYDDGAYTIYVNGLYNGDDDFGRLAHDFNCTNADDIYYEPLAEGVRHFKETEEGREVMCESFSRLADKVADERAEQTTIKYVKLMMKNMKCSLEDALNTLEIKGKERAIIAKQLQK